jgi:hydroxymethyl cephem carbamoyltransferase
MIILSVKPGHDGSVAILEDDHLVLCVESEKDSFPRHHSFTPEMLIDVTENIAQEPDVIALSGWYKRGRLGHRLVGSGYLGVDAISIRRGRFFGRGIDLFSSSHERSHLMTAIGLAPDELCEQQAVLIWEGAIGSFYLVDAKGGVCKTVSVIAQPGARYAFLYALADPTFPDTGGFSNFDDSGKVMALASFSDASGADRAIRETVEQILNVENMYPAPKWQFKKSALYNVGVETAATKTASALMTEKIFSRFAQAAEAGLPKNIPLRISGGCGLNCHWNQRWRQLGYFSNVFVPPCTNDSGSAIGTAIDALRALKGQIRIRWNVYSGLGFIQDVLPSPVKWSCNRLDYSELANSVASGEVTSWVQGQYEIGPRALGNRSLIAEPFRDSTRERLNRIKRREQYRPIAPCCRLEDVGLYYEDTFEDAFMLYARRSRSQILRAVTHVDKSARLQTVTRESNTTLYELLSAFSRRTGVGVLCNTSLNFKGLGFINRMSDLVEFSEKNQIENMVVGQAWYRRI